MSLSLTPKAFPGTIRELFLTGFSMNAKFNLWSCPFISVEDKKSLDSKGLPVQDRVEALLALFSNYPADDTTTPILNQSLLLKGWIKEGLNPFEKLTPPVHPKAYYYTPLQNTVLFETVFDAALASNQESLILSCLQSSYCPDVKELNSWSIPYGEHRATKLPRHISPLCFAARMNHTKLIQALIEKGVKLDIRDEEDQTPLHICSSLRAVDLLLKAGAHPSLKDRYGRTPENSCRGLTSNKAEQENMRRRIVSERANKAQASDSPNAQQQLIKKLFASVWQDDEAAFSAYFDALGLPIESLRHHTHKVSLLVWAVRRHITSSCASDFILNRILESWDPKALKEESHPGIPDQMWVWAQSTRNKNRANPCRKYLHANRLLQDLIEVSAARLAISPALVGMNATLQSAWGPGSIGLIKDIIARVPVEKMLPLLNSLAEQGDPILLKALSSISIDGIPGVSPSTLPEALALCGVLADRLQDKMALRIPLLPSIMLDKEQAWRLVNSKGFSGWLKFEPILAANWQSQALDYAVKTVSLNKTCPIKVRI